MQCGDQSGHGAVEPRVEEMSLKGFLLPLSCSVQCLTSSTAEAAGERGTMLQVQVDLPEIS